MPDLGTQIRTYIDETSMPVTPEDVFDRPIGEGQVRPLARIPVRRQVSRGVLVATTAAVVALLVVGVPLLVNRGSDASPAGVTASTAQTTTVVEDSTPTTIRQIPVDVASSVVPGLGTLTWERVDGDEMTLPTVISDHVDGRYVSYESGRTWTSPDAVTWTFEEPSPIDDVSGFYEQGDWAIGSSADHNELFRKTGDSWVPVELPAALSPDVDWIDWRQQPAIPVESGGAVVADMTEAGDIRWADVYGTFEVDCGGATPCQVPPIAMWNPIAEIVEIWNPASGDTLGEAKVVVAGDEVQFVDRLSGDVLFTATGGGAYSVEQIVDHAQGGGEYVAPGGYVSNDGGETWVWVDFPWQHHADLLAVPDGGFAAVVVDYGWEESQTNPPVQPTLWTSADGISWTDHRIPEFAVDDVLQIDVRSSDDGLLATVVTGSDDTSTYVSTNALDWEPVDLPFPAWFQEFETDFGIVVNAMPQSRELFWVSTDGGSVWYEVEGPPGSHEPSGAGYAGGGAAGDLLYVSVGSESPGGRTLWIGRFEP